MRKSIWTLLLVLSLLSVCRAAQVEGTTAWIELGSINIEHGLSLRNGADGQNDPVTVGGSECRRNNLDSEPPSYYFYFDYEPSEGRIIRPVYVTVEYYDSGFGQFALEYDSADISAPEHGAYKTAGVELILDSKKWRKAVFELNDARFEGRQKLGADFRIVCFRELDVRMVSVEMGASSNLNWMQETWAQRAEKCPAALTAPRSIQVVFEGSKPRSYRDVSQALEELRLSAPMFRVLGATSVRIEVSSEVMGYDTGRYDWAWCGNVIRTLEQNGLKWSPYLKITDESFLRQFAERYAAGMMIESIFVDGEVDGGSTAGVESKLAAVRKVFRKTPLYVCLDGEGVGAALSSLLRAAAKYDAGVLIAGSSDITEAAAGLAHAYECPVVLEVPVDSHSVAVTRSVFEAVDFGVKGVFVREPQTLIKPGVLESWRLDYRWLGTYAPPPRVAVLMPSQEGSVFGEKLWRLRDVFDFDIVDAVLIRQGVLAGYKNLFIVEDGILDRDIIELVKSWVKGGGVLVLFESGRFRDAEGSEADFEEMFDMGSEGVKSYGSGSTVFIHGGWDNVGALRDEIGRRGVDISADGLADGVYVLTLPKKGFLVFNSNDKEVDKELRIGRKTRHIRLQPMCITRVD